MITKTPRIDTYNRRMTTARGLLAKGFTAKSHRKDAMDYCNRAFEDAMDLIGDKLIAARDAKTMDDQSKEWRDLYWGRPQAHVWNEQKAAPFRKHFPDLVKLADDAAALRQQCKDADIVAKAPSKRQQQLAVEDAKRMTCQICGRPILAETGRIAHHGYQRPGTGWQTESCAGALELPYEVSRDVILKLIPTAIEREKNQAAFIKRLRNEETPIIATFEIGERWNSTRQTKLVTFNRETFPYAYYFAPNAFQSGRVNDDGTVYDYDKRKAVPAFDYFLDKAVGWAETELRQMKDWRKYLEKRRDAWKITHKWTEGGWVKIEEAP